MNKKPKTNKTSSDTDKSKGKIISNNFDQQNNIYPNDIQGLFERLGIE